MTDYIGLPLHSGPGASPDQACLQQKAAIIHAHVHGYLNKAGLGAVFSDRPCWQNQAVNSAGIAINDRIRTSEGFALLDARCTMRMVEASKRSDDDAELRVLMRLAKWSARSAQESADRARANADDPDRQPISDYEHDVMLVEWLEELLDQWEKAVAEEGAQLQDGMWQELAKAGLVDDTELPDDD